MSTRAVAALIRDAFRTRRSFALVRIGDGEALTMAQGTVRSPEDVAGRAFLRHAGVTAPDLLARDRVVEAVRRADLVGVAVRRDLPDFAPLTEEVFAYYGLRPSRLCDCCVNYALQGEGLLQPLLAGQRLFLVNRRWRLWAEALRRLYGLTVVGGATVDHFGQAEAAVAAAGRYHFDLALLAAGVPATWLAVSLARRYRCIALDIGRLADLMIDLLPGEA
jgi:hypothetical protein